MKTNASKEQKTKILREIHSGSLETLTYMKETSPNVHWSEIRYEKTGDTILHVAARLGLVEIVKTLLKDYTPKKTDCKNNDDKTPLHEAAQFSKYCVCEVLLENNANINALKRADWTPLMLACTKAGSEDSYKTVEVLLSNGALVNYENKDGWTALHLISREGDESILKCLIKYGLDVQKVTKNGRTALHIACLHNHLNIVITLLDLGLDVNCKDKCGNTPLHEAVLGNSLPVFHYLVGRSDVNVLERNNSDFTILHLAASVGSEDLIKYIIKRLNFNANITTKIQLTPLHCAAKSKKIRAFELLVELGANESIRDKFERLAH
ncbi:ankyrin repeat domain-containing protein 16-like [Agrilus planipennis]|uniref:Ankyrin repeat domain-containing protein 16-like n=1 Tax=Agrilus planipennis TaxID=224129 RepID=A0A1W4XJN2_AGRPL|nr:ankyrin repeat domain-containing protein 16-like [Agrilus planipennis]